LKLVFFGEPRDEAVEHAVESPPIITIPLIILAGLTILGGLLNFPFFSEAGAEAAEERADDIRLELEEWLEHAISSFELSEAIEGEEALLHLPHTPISIQLDVALISTALALSGVVFALLVYRRRPETAEDADPLERTPIWWFAILPLNTLYMRYFVPAYNRSAQWLADSLDDRFWHDFVHDRIIRDTFVNFAGFLNARFDTGFIDNGLVNGSGRAMRWLADQLRAPQTGYVRNYALVVFLGVVLLLTYFLFIAG
jgi:NADH-quinone oxidoreductase subunit L